MLMIIGDFNAHIGQLNQIEENVVASPNVFDKRKSLHETCHDRGLTLVNVMENVDLYVVNGCTRGDISANFTYLSENGNSSIDLV